MMSAFLALGAAGLYGVADFIAGLATRGRSAIGMALFSQGVGLVVLAILAFLTSPQPPLASDLMWAVAAGVAGPISLILLYRGLADGLISVVAPVTGVCTIAFPVALGTLALGEQPTPTVLFGVAVAAASVVLLGLVAPAEGATSARPTRLMIPFWLAVASGITGGIFFVALDRTSADSGLWPMVAARVTGVSGMALFALLSRQLSIWARQAREVPRVAFAGVFDAFAGAAYLLAVRGGSVAIVVTLVCLYPAVTVFLARVFLGERLTGWQKAGIVLAAASVVLITKP